MVAPIDAATNELIFNTLPDDAGFATTVEIPSVSVPLVVTAIPAINVVTPVIVATFTILGAAHLPTIPLLFIYQPKTMDNAMALPGEVLPSIAVIILVLPTLTEEYAVSTPTVLTPVGDEELRFPVTLPVTLPTTFPVTSPSTLPIRAPLKLVAVATPVTTSSPGKTNGTIVILIYNIINL